MVTDFCLNWPSGSPVLLKGVTKFLSALASFIIDMGEIRHKNLHTVPMSICEFGENRSREGRNFLTCTSGITLNRAP